MVKDCAISFEPTVSPSSLTRLPSALFGNSTWDTPVVISG